MERLERLTIARGLLANLTPLKKDCGKLCGCACCKADESGENGMLLLPGEEAFYTGTSESFSYRLKPDDTYGKYGKRLICEGICQRENRPFACRIFPLRLRIQEEDCHLEIDPRAWAVCPLPDMGGVRGMSVEFRKAALEAGKLLIEDKGIRLALLNEQTDMDRERYL